VTRRAFYKRFPGDWIMGTRDLTLEERGAYGDILDLIYDKGRPVPDEPRFLAGFLGVSVRKWNGIRAALLAAGKLEVQGDYLANARANRELGAAQDEVRQQVEWGRMGGKRRAQAEKKAREAALKARQGNLGLDKENGGKTPVEAKGALPAQPTAKQAKATVSPRFERVFSDFSTDFREENIGETEQKPQKSEGESQGSLKPARASQSQSPEEETKVSPPLSPPKLTARPARKKPAKPKRIPKDFDARAALTNGTGEIVAAWPDGMFERETDKFLDWVASNGTTSKDWLARFRNWLRKADDEWRRHGSRASGKPSGWNFAANR
jgi:uncharacterized protein YdaU (DUF1376 family)